MRKSSIAASLFAALLTLSADPVSASWTFPGTMCLHSNQDESGECPGCYVTQQIGRNLVYGTYNIGTVDPADVVCPANMFGYDNHLVEADIYIYNRNPQVQFECSVYVNDEDGNVVAINSDYTSVASAAMQTMSLGIQGATTRHWISFRCSIPPYVPGGVSGGYSHVAGYMLTW